MLGQARTAIGIMASIAFTYLFTNPQSVAASGDEHESVNGRCSESSYIAEGSSNDDLSLRQSRFFCDVAGIVIYANNKHHVLISFLEKKSHSPDMLGFAGFLGDDGVFLKVERVYLRGHAVTASGGVCKLSFSGQRSAHLESILCGSEIISPDNRRVAVNVEFVAVRGQ